MYKSIKLFYYFLIILFFSNLYSMDPKTQPQLGPTIIIRDCKDAEDKFNSISGYSQRHSQKKSYEADMYISYVRAYCYALD